MWLVWAAMAGATLSKGLIGIALPGGALVAYTAVTRDYALWRRLCLGSGFAIYLVLTAPWFVAVARANEEFLQFFFVHEHLQRFLTTEHRRVQAWWFFIPILFIGFLPWMFLLVPACVRAWRRDSGASEFHWRRFLLLWAGFIVVFFSASGSKLATYILPAFPALAILIAEELSHRNARALAKWLAPTALVALAGLFLAWNAPDKTGDEWTRGLYENARPWVVGGVAVFLLGTVISAAFLRRGLKWSGIVALAVATILFYACMEDGYEELSPRQSGHDVAIAMKPWLKPETRVYSVRHYEQSVPFYIGRTMTLVDYVDEFELGQKMEPALGFRTVEEFKTDWLRDGDALAIMQPGIYEELHTEGLPMKLLHEDPRRVLVRKP